MRCNLCEQFYKDYPLQNSKHPTDRDMLVHQINKYHISAPLQCAFDNSENEFREDNWSCQTMGLLRDIAEQEGFYMRDDMFACSIGIIHIPEAAESHDSEIQQGYIVMTWYKNRGATGKAYVMCDDREPQILNLQTAEAVIKYYCHKERP